MPENNNEDTFLASGNIPEIKAQLMNYKFIEKILSRLEVDSGSSSPRPYPSFVRGLAYIKVMFKGTIAGTDISHRSEKLFRLMKDDPRTISLQRIQQLAERIKNKFNNFTYTTGVECYTYNNPDQGFNRCWDYYQSQAEAQKLIEQVLDIDGYFPDWRRFTKSVVPIPGDRFAEVPDKVLQANVFVRLERERPTALMSFHKARMKLPHIKREFDIVDKNLDIIEELPFASD